MITFKEHGESMLGRDVDLEAHIKGLQKIAQVRIQTVSFQPFKSSEQSLMLRQCRSTTLRKQTTTSTLALRPPANGIARL